MAHPAPSAPHPLNAQPRRLAVRRVHATLVIPVTMHGALAAGTLAGKGQLALSLPPPVVLAVSAKKAYDHPNSPLPWG